jgi:uncharacterized membrane protein
MRKHRPSYGRKYTAQLSWNIGLRKNAYDISPILFVEKMTSTVFVLVLISAISHAAWNFAARKAVGNLVAIWLGLWLGSAFIFPVVIGITVYQGLPKTVPMLSIICILATGLIHSVYFRLVAAGYEHGEISLVYPIARGSGIALTGFLASLLFKENFAMLGSIGIGLISVGILLLSATENRKENNVKAITLALSIGITIVAYSLIDKMGVHYTNPVVYIWSMFLISAILLTPAVVRRHHCALGLLAKQYIGFAIIIGGGSIATYLIILYAFTQGRVGYIVAVREIAVVLGSLAGIVFLKERFTVSKAIAIPTIVIGIICIKMG